MTSSEDGAAMSDEERRELMRVNGLRYREYMANLPAEEKAVLDEMAESRVQALMADPAYHWPADE
jgi:hypothetical protein